MKASKPNKTRETILKSVGYLGAIDCGNFTQRHFNELAKMEDEKIVRSIFINSNSNRRTYFLNKKS